MLKLFLCFLGVLFLSHCINSTRFTITSPKAFRLGARETVILNLHGYQSATVNAYLQLEEEIGNSGVQRVTGNAVNEPIKLTLQIRQEIGHESIREFEPMQKVRLIVDISNAQPASGNTRQEYPVLVSRESGYLFVITDQPVYKPNDVVIIKIFTLNQEMAISNLPVRIVVKSPPDNIGVATIVRNMINNQFITWEFDLDENPVFGTWTVEVTYVINGYETTAERKFLVERYVLPTFDVNVVLDQNYILADDEAVRGTLYANYSYGEPVSGSFLLKLFMKKTSDSDELLVYSTTTANANALISNGVYRFDIVLRGRLNSTLSTAQALERMAANGGFMYIKAAVRGRGSGVLENYASPKIPVLQSPYVIDTKRTSVFFITNVEFALVADVFFAVGKMPSVGVPFQILVDGVEQCIRDEDQGILCETNAHGHINHPMRITSGGVKDVRIRVGAGRQVKEVQLSFRPYVSQGSKYLLIELPSTDPYEVTQFMRISFSVHRATPTEIRYFILSRGSIVDSGKIDLPNGVTRVQQRVRVTQSMVPSGRIVAYFMVGAEIVANSLWFDVVNQCKRDLEVVLPSQVTPADTFQIAIRGTPNAWVSISAVDRAAYFLYNSSRLTRQNMFDEMGDYDQGCSRNGGVNTENVFLEAGLLLKSNNYNPPMVNSLSCSEQNSLKRKKRQAVAADQNEIIEKELKKCYEDGKLPPVLPEDTCETRAARVRNSVEARIPDEAVEECVRRFLNSCQIAERMRIREAFAAALGRSADVDVAELDTSLNEARSNFNPNMLFRNVLLGNRGTFTFETQASHSISTFEVDMVSRADQKNGFCIEPTRSIRIFQEIFIQVITPYSLKIMEQASLRIVIFNYGDSDEEISLDVLPHENGLLCTHFKAGHWSTMFRTEIAAGRSASTILAVLPLKLPADGEMASVSFQVRRFGRRQPIDQIMKEILIEESGEILDTFKSYVIDVDNNRNQRIPIHFNFPERFVPGSRQCSVYAYSNLLGPSIEVDPINNKPNDVSSLFRQPRGCGEQNMIYSAPNVYAHMYLQAVGDLREGTPAYDASIQRIEAGYTRELSYRSNVVQQRAFAVWTHYQPSTWLNAFVDKVFTKAKEYDTDLNMGPICTSLEWLLSKQSNDGKFIESGQVIHREMHGAVTTGGNNYLTLTAYVVISLLEAPNRCSPALNARIAAAAQNAVNYLISNKNNPTFSAPYGLALLTYALMLHNPNSLDANQALSRLKELKIEQGGTVHWEGRSLAEIAGTDLHAYWYQQRPQAVYVEATAYALLAIIAKARTNNPPRQDDLNLARKIVIWLIQQRNAGGAFISTQDTVIGLQALATYQTWIAGVGTVRQETDFTVQLRAINRETGLDWQSNAKQLTQNNARYRVPFDIPANVVDNLNVLATISGVGEGVLSYRCIYRTVVDEESCFFNIDYRTNILNLDEIEEIRAGTTNLKMQITLTVSARHNATEMSIIEVGMLSGFAPIERTLFPLLTSRRADGIVDRYEISDVSIVFYLQKIPVNPPVVLVFQMEQKIYIPLPEPAKINVYDYYEPAIHCGKFYSITNTTKLITSGCAENENENEGNSNICKCAEGGCMICRNRYEQVHQTCAVVEGDRNQCGGCPQGNCTNLWKSTCDENKGNDFAFEITINSISPPEMGDVFYTLRATVNQVHRTGSQENFNQSVQTIFLVRRDCFENCKFQPYERDRILPALVENVPLLVIGSPPEKIQRNGVTSHQYRLGENSIIERIIPRRACRRYNSSACARANTPRKVARCEKQRLTKLACDRYSSLVEALQNNGCD